MAERNSRRPLPGCPAQHGKGTDISAADFILVVHDCECDRDGRPTTTEAFGYFRLPGDEHENDVLLTAGFEVPVGSPIARMAHQVSADTTGALIHIVGTMLRGNVAHCPCADKAECPALNEIRLLEAMECAIELRREARNKE